MPAYKDSFNLSVSSNGPTAVNFNFAVQNVVLQIQPPPAEEPQLPSVPISLDELESIEDNPSGDGDK